jgi:hypothetical protein
MPKAVHPDPQINSLYKARRKAAERSNTSGHVGIEGWLTLEQVENQLNIVDPDGDWRYEGDNWDGQGWQVRRPVLLCAHGVEDSDDCIQCRRAAEF